jgi:molecular chaperone GrpE
MEDLELAPETDTPAIEESTIDPLAELQLELDRVKDQFLRARAETENIRKRALDDVARAHKFAIENFAEHLIPVADSLYAALAAETDDAKSLKEGLEITLKQLISAFAKGKLVEVNPEVGSEFDANRHQAIATVESEQAANTVVAVMQRGYMIADRLLRPAMITVSQAKEDQDGE